MARYRRSVRASSARSSYRTRARSTSRRRVGRANYRTGRSSAQVVRLVVQAASPTPVATVPLGYKAAPAPKKSKF